MKRKGINECAKMEESFRHAGKRPTSVQSVDTNKGTVGEPDFRCRLFAQDFKVGKAEDCFYALMLPVEAKKMAFAKAVER